MFACNVSSLGSLVVNLSLLSLFLSHTASPSTLVLTPHRPLFVSYYLLFDPQLSLALPCFPLLSSLRLSDCFSDID
jgi:hypothetical protein